MTTSPTVYQIDELESFTQDQFNQLARLMEELDPTLPLKESTLKELVESADNHLMVLRKDDKIIGCYTLCIFTSPTGRKASLEDVVISTEHRGEKLGDLLMEHVIRQLEQFSPIHLQLTSRSSRIAANHLYQKYFKSKETNVYVSDIN